jgi:hypothetical protein
MIERIRSQSRESVERHGSGPAPAGADPLANLAYVISPGGRRESLPVAGMTVGEIRRRLADRLNIDPSAQAMIGARDVAADVVLQAGENLFFRRAAGEKGRGAK